MKRLTIAFSAVLIAILITSNGISASEHAIALQEVNPLTSLIGAILDPILKAIRSFINVIAGFVRDLNQLIFRTLPKAIHGLVHTIALAIRDTTSEAVRKILESILTLIEEEVENILKLIEDLTNRQRELERILEEIRNAIEDVLEDVRRFLGECLAKIPIQAIAILRRLTNDVTKCAAGTIQLISNELLRVNEVVEKVTGLVDNVLGKISECLDNEEEEAVSCLEGVRDVIDDSLKEIQDALKLNETVKDAVVAVQKCIQVVVNAANSTLTC